MKNTAIIPNLALLNKPKQVKEPANLKQMLITQSNLLLNSLVIKQRELNKLIHKI
jgi:hypothetical protein